MNIAAIQFIETWEDFISDRLKSNDWLGNWNSNSKWSDFILGGKTSSYEKSPLGIFFQSRFGDNLRFRSEDNSVDLTFFEESSVFDFHTLDKNWQPKTFTRSDYPSNYLAIIEHENNIYTAWEEIAKLTYYRAQLKVLITYNSKNELAPGKRVREIEMLEKSMEGVLKKSAKMIPENNLIEYLLIVGGIENKKLTWNYSIFNTIGKKIQIE